MMQEMGTLTLCDLMTVYTLFVDVVKHCMQINHSIDALDELRRLHYYRRLTIGTAAMKLAVHILKA